MPKLKNRNMDFYQSLEEKWGDYLRTGEKDKKDIIKAIPTGSFSLDAALGIGGIPMRRFTEISGAEGSGKTTLALTMAGNAIRMGYNVLYVDPEQAVDLSRASILAKMDVKDTDKFVLLQPSIMEEALGICEDGIKSKKFGLIIVDSLAALAPQKVLDDDLDDANIALLARIMPIFLQRNLFTIRYYDVAFVGLNQIRDKIGMYVKMYDTPGGHAWKHATSVRIQLSKLSDIEQGSEKIGITTKFVIKKSKVSPPFRASTFPVMFDTGIDRTRNVVEFAESLGVLLKNGAHYKFNDITLGKGMSAAIAYLDSNDDMRLDIEKACYSVVNTGSVLYSGEEDSNETLT